MTQLTPNPAHDVTGNGTECHYDLARQLEMRGYTVGPDPENNECSWVRHPMTGETILAEINGDAVATVTNI